MQTAVGVLQVSSERLQAALMPSPTGVLAALRALLPRMAAALYNDFIAQVHEATSRLTASSTDVEEYVQKLTFLATLKVRPA